MDRKMKTVYFSAVGSGYIEVPAELSKDEIMEQFFNRSVGQMEVDDDICFDGGFNIDQIEEE